MKYFARISTDGVVKERIELPDDLDPAAIIHPDIVAEFVACPPEVAQNWILVDGTFTPPAPQPNVEEPPKRKFTFLEFMGLFAEVEQAAIVDSPATKVKLFLLMAAGASFIDLDDPRTEPGVQLLLDEGLITPERKLAVMAGQGAA